MTEQFGLFPPSPFDPNRPGPLDRLSPLYRPGIVPPTPGTEEYKQLQLWIQKEDELAAAVEASRRYAQMEAMRLRIELAEAASAAQEALRQRLLLQNP